MNDEQQKRGLLLVIALALGALYLAGGPVWDDHDLIDVYLRKQELLVLWSHPVGGGDVGQGYYRPLALSCMAVLGSTVAIHFAAMILHTLSVGLLYEQLKGQPGAFYAALIFAVHPLCSEVLGWASAFPDILALHFGLWAAYWLGRERWVSCAVFLALGLLCKENAALPVLAMAMVSVRNIRLWLMLALIGGSYFGLRYMVGVGGSWAMSNKLQLIPLALGWPLASLLLPYPLTAVRDLLAAPGWVVPLGMGVMLGAGWLAIRGEKYAKAGCLLMLLGPAIALPPTLDGYLAAERYAYVAVLGLSWLLSSLPLDRTGFGRFVWLIVAFAIPIHVQRAEAWRHDQALFHAATKSLPESSYAWHFLGFVQLRDDLYDDAAAAFLRAIEAGHPHPLDRYYRLVALVESKQYQAALSWVEKGPRNNLSANYIAYWARAAAGVGRTKQALQLTNMLKQPDGSYAGPPWVKDIGGPIEE